jgi:DNA ligase (NAD+)
MVDRIEEIKQLEDVIALWSNAYYSGNPIVSDPVFDQTLERLKTLEPDHPLITKVGHGYIPTDSRLKKYHHTSHVGSLPKMKLNECTEDKGWNRNRKFVCTPKFDGGSVVAYYDENGELIRVLSRGDGEEGFDITHNVSHLVHKYVSPHYGIISVRGEILMSYEDAKTLNANHPRNKAVGVSQSLDSATDLELGMLEIVWYSADQEYNNEQTKTEMIRILKNAGFQTPSYIAFSDWKTFLEYANSIDTKSVRLEKHPNKTFPIDGLVLNIENIPSEAIAIKFENEEVETTVNGIVWKLSRTGRLVPVLEVEPVFVSGATISRVTANNHQWLTSRQAGIGAKIKIVRSNEIIPMLTDVISTSEKYGNIENCPSCGEKLAIKGVDLCCVNDKCPKKEESVVELVFTHFAVDGIGPTIINELINYEDLTTIEDLHSYKEWFAQADRFDVYESDNNQRFLKDHFQNEFGPETAMKIIKTLRNAFTSNIKIGDIFRFANIPNVGKTFSKCVDSSVDSKKFLETVQGKDEIDVELFKTCFSNYLQPIELKSYQERIKSLVEMFKNQIEILDKSGNRDAKKEKSETYKFCLTGKLSKKRDEVVKEFEEFGHAFASETSCDILIADAPSSSSKYQKALKRQIPIMTEQEFRSKYC